MMPLSRNVRLSLWPHFQPFPTNRFTEHPSPSLQLLQSIWACSPSFLSSWLLLLLPSESPSEGPRGCSCSGLARQKGPRGSIQTCPRKWHAYRAKWPLGKGVLQELGCSLPVSSVALCPGHLEPWLLQLGWAQAEMLSVGGEGVSSPLEPGRRIPRAAFPWQFCVCACAWQRRRWGSCLCQGAPPCREVTGLQIF